MNEQKKKKEKPKWSEYTKATEVTRNMWNSVNLWLERNENWISKYCKYKLRNECRYPFNLKFQENNY